MGIRKSVMFLAVFVVIVPAMASVDIVCTVTGPNEVTVSFSTSGEAELVRMISLDVQVNDPCVYIADVNCVSEGYNIYPGSIYIDNDGNVVDWGTCAGVLDGNDMTSEQGSLYVGAANEPAEGDLFIVTLGGCSSDADATVSVTVSENALRDGVVMEDVSNPATVNLSGCTVNVGECIDCPCLGDVSDTSGWGPPDGKVDFGDLIALYGEMILVYPTGDPVFVYDIGLPPHLVCGDIDGNLTINFSDLITIYTVLVTQYPTGDPFFIFDVNCPFNDPF